MGTLQDWKDDGANGTGWPVNGILDDTGGLGKGDLVIYHSDGMVKKGDGSVWGTFDTAHNTADYIEGTVSAKNWLFKITCPDGNLHGELSNAQAVMSHTTSESRRKSHHRGHSHDGENADPTPGSWTAAEGSGHTFSSERERERERERAA